MVKKPANGDLVRHNELVEYLTKTPNKGSAYKGGLNWEDQVFVAITDASRGEADVLAGETEDGKDAVNELNSLTGKIYIAIHQDHPAGIINPENNNCQEHPGPANSGNIERILGPYVESPPEGTTSTSSEYRHGTNSNIEPFFNSECGSRNHDQLGY